MASLLTGQLVAASRIVLLALALLVSDGAAADVQIGSAGSYPLSHEFSYLIDPTDQLTLRDVTQIGRAHV